MYAPANPPRSLSGDATYIHSFLKTIDGPVVLVGHSYGGAVITKAAAGLKNVKAPAANAAVWSVGWRHQSRGSPLSGSPHALALDGGRPWTRPPAPPSRSRHQAYVPTSLGLRMSRDRGADPARE